MEIYMSNIRDIPYAIRWAKPEDWPETMQMVWRTFMRFEAADYTEEGVINFQDFLTNGKIYQMFLNGRYPMLIALDGEKIIGEISVRGRNFISLLFVDEEYHMQGVGRALIETMAKYLRDVRGEIYMSVKAAPYAVAFYRKTGFHACAPEESFSGIRVTSMERFL